MKKPAECDDSSLAPELPISTIRGMCPGIRSDVPNDSEHIQSTDNSEDIEDNFVSPPDPRWTTKQH